MNLGSIPNVSSSMSTNDAVALTNNTELANRMKLLRSHGITRNQDEMMKISKESWYYEQIDLGYNYRMTDIQAALGITQLNKIDKYLNKRILRSCPIEEENRLTISLILILFGSISWKSSFDSLANCTF